jgi:hypothetical protein
MKNFNSKKNKINSLDTTIKDTSSNIDNQDIKNKALIIKINKDSIYNLTKKLNNLSFDWEYLDTDGLVFSQYKNWTLEFSEIDIRLLPFLDVKFLYRRGEGTVIDDNDIVPTIQKVCEIEDVPNKTSDYLKKVTMKISFSFSTFTSDETYQAKLNILFLNPRNYI